MTAPVDALRTGASTGASAGTWTGAWVSDRLDLTLRTTGSAVGLDLTDLVGLAVRRNPRRAHLLVSRVLGKHVPTDPRVVRGAGLLLGALAARSLVEPPPVEATDAGADLDERLLSAGAVLRDALDGDPVAPTLLTGVVADLVADVPASAVVLGYAETATALGHAVADALGGAPYLHSTRRPVAGVPSVGAFEEDHSHATTHLLLPADPALLASAAPLVLVDDELSTGTTALHTIEAVHRLAARDRYVVATLVDLRTDDDRARAAALADRLGVRIDVVALVAGRVDAPDDVVTRGAALVAEVDAAVAVPRAAAATPSDAHADAARQDDASGTEARGDDDGAPAATAGRPGHAPVRRVDVGWPAALPETARHGVDADDRRALDVALPACTAALRDALAGGSSPALDAGGRVLVLGTEELMDAPLRLAESLAVALDGTTEVRFSTTTRSPVLAVDDAAYAIRSSLTFPAHDDPADAAPGAPGHRRFAYNVAPTTPGDRFDAVVVVTDAPGDTPALTAPAGLLDELAAHTGDVLLVVLPGSAARRATAVRAGATTSAGPGGDARPAAGVGSVVGTRPDDDARPGPAGPDAAALPAPLRGPAFGSYAPDEVTWLLTDLSGVALEAPVEEREEAVQSGGAHYAESLPVEYQPSAAYVRLFDEALEAGAERLAHAVGVVAEQILAARGDGATLVSLARAGTPVGILVRRWARLVHGLDLPHHAVSIVRGRGIDDVALRFLAVHHDPASVVFVDGWTGKGAIARELGAALADHGRRTGVAFPRDLAVLADPGRCVRLAGTRDDFLVPSACLNSTVSGLVSRTVLNRDLIGPDQFHGAKFYADLAPADVSGRFLDAVEARFGDVRDAVERDWRDLAAAHQDVDWAGWAAVERIVEAYGIGDVNLVKPGVGETTRVLLRRVPWRVLVRPDVDPADVAHVRHLAAERGVPVETVADLPYSCVGLIHPRFTAGATGADGLTVRADA
ncbi:phosphoribosyltransferase [Cellulomonas sp. H30R-01]|uniref:phosphoribosyltransferase n=1 Tax=Cellulomonas sp. H30R-01 TaxID=2704467 RepID=UPI00138D2D72|nr:phosphoribosyltransferase [Cellulomonas sp. H30R-01]QHT57680.1 phosphoribosyltransferase [Cellulomonas sp. H30R-01]